MSPPHALVLTAHARTHVFQLQRTKDTHLSNHRSLGGLLNPPPPPPASSWPFSNLCPPTAALPLGRAGCRRTSKHGLMGKDVIPVCCVLISGHRLEEHSFTRTTTRTRAMQQFSFFAPPSPVQPTWHRASGKTGSLCVLDVLGGKKRIWWDYSFATEGRPQTCCGSIRYAISP